MNNYPLEKIKSFLLDRGSLLNWRSIENRSNLPKNTIKNFLFHNQDFPLGQDLEPFLAILSKVGFIIDSLGSD